jgi:hypothetical protein
VNKEKWKALPQEEKEKIRARHRERKKRQDQAESYKRKRDQEKAEADRWGRHAKPGDWLCYRRQDGWGLLELYGKIVRFKAWNDDGHNSKRAPRNKRIIVEIEPHLHDEPRIIRCCRLGEFAPVNEMMVIAEAAR